MSTSAATGIFLPNDGLLKSTFVAARISGEPDIVPGTAILLKKRALPGPDPMCSTFKFVEQCVQRK